MESSRPLNVRRACFWIVIVALCVRLAVIPFLISDQLSPERDHWRFGYEVGRIGRSIVEGRGFGNPLFANTGPTAWLMPVYPYIVAGVFKLFGVYTKTSAVVLLSLNALTAALTCLPIFFLARESFGEYVALWSGWLWAFFPYSIYFPEDRIWATWLATLLLCILFLLILRFEKNPPGLRGWIGFGALWGVSALADPMVLAPLVPLGLWLCWRLHRKKHPWFVRNVLAAIVFAAIVSPWFVRNYRVFHHFIPFRDSIGLELYIGNNGETFWWFAPLAGPWHNEAQWREYAQGELAYMYNRRREAEAFIRSHPATFIELSVRRAVYLWTGYWSLDRRYLHEFPFDSPNIPFCTALTIFAIAGLWHAFRRAGAAVATPYLLVLLFFRWFTMSRTLTTGIAVPLIRSAWSWPPMQSLRY